MLLLTVAGGLTASRLQVTEYDCQKQDRDITICNQSSWHLSQMMEFQCVTRRNVTCCDYIRFVMSNPCCSESRTLQSMKFWNRATEKCLHYLKQTFYYTQSARENWTGSLELAQTFVCHCKCPRPVMFHDSAASLYPTFLPEINFCIVRPISTNILCNL